jgi:hypothetical protein
MTNSSFVSAENQEPEIETSLRAMRRALLARYDSGAVPHFVFAVLRQLEAEISWFEHQRTNRG